MVTVLTKILSMLIMVYGGHFQFTCFSSVLIGPKNLTWKPWSRVTHLKGLLHVDGLLGRRLEVGDLVLAVAPLLRPLGRHLHGESSIQNYMNILNILIHMWKILVTTSGKLFSHTNPHFPISLRLVKKNRRVP